MWEDSSFEPVKMDAFDGNRTENTFFQVNCDGLEELEYENSLNEFSIGRDEYEFSRQAFCDSSQQSDASVFTFVPLLEQNAFPPIEETSKNTCSEYLSSSEQRHPNISPAPNTHNNWNAWVQCSGSNVCGREIGRGGNVAEDSKSFGLLHERVRVLEEENLKLNLQVSKYKEENSFLREALDRFHAYRGFCGAETVASVCYPESEEDSSSNVRERRKRRRRIDDSGWSNKQSCRSRISDEVERSESNENVDSGDGGYFQHKLDSLYLKPEQPTNSSASPVEFVSLVRDLTEPLMKTDPARAATLTMFIFALALGLFSFQCKSTLNATAQRSQSLERLLWNNLQDCMKNGDYKGTLFSDMKKEFVGGSLDAASVQDAERVMRSYLDASVGHILEETSPAMTDQLFYTREDSRLDEVTDVSRAYVSTWERAVDLEKFGEEEFGGN
ncbi:hypothetical protein Gasu2_04160 [Galdieria sulphuraria]|nr:hypothetical protein Gasu2_04160 [Galdieria sulphuraria]